ncbi:MAG: PPC domain-containing protein, partial [Pseudomonadota bacterium]
DLLGSAGELIATSEHLFPDDPNLVVERTLAAGTYFVRVFPSPPPGTPVVGDGGYQLSLSITGQETGDDDTLATARAVTLSSTAQVFNDRIGGTDTNDFYRFRLLASGSFSAVLSGLGADADLQLLDSTGAEIAQSINAATDEDTIAMTLAAGSYFVRVFPFAGETAYRLSLAVTGEDTGSDDTRETARAVTLSSTPQVFSDRIGGTDSNDFYRFRLLASGSFSAALSGLGADADLQLLDSTGAEIASSINASTDDDTIAMTLAAGTYFVRVFPFAGETAYRLSLAVTGEDTGGDDTRETARAVTLSSTPQVFSDRIGGTDSNDFYRFRLFASGSFSAALSGLGADADLQLLDSTGSEIAFSINASTDEDTIAGIILAAGTYFVRVFPFAGETAYQLSLAVTGEGTGGDDTRETARAVTLSSTAQVFNDRIGGTDSNDFYGFRLSVSGGFSAALSGLGADADLQLLDSTGAVIAQSIRPSIDDDTIAMTLAAGTYFVRVFPFTGETAYRLSLAVTGQDTVDEAGNSRTAARDLGTVTSVSTSIGGRVSAIDTDDFFRFQVAESGRLAITLDGLSADADLEFQDSNGTVLDRSVNGGALSDSVSVPITPGTYFARVFRFDGDTNYNLTLGLSADPRRAELAPAATPTWGQADPFASDLGLAAGTEPEWANRFDPRNQWLWFAAA